MSFCHLDLLPNIWITCQLNIQIISILNTKICGLLQISKNSIGCFLVAFLWLSHELTMYVEWISIFGLVVVKQFRLPTNYLYNVPFTSSVSQSLLSLTFCSSGVDTPLHPFMLNLFINSCVYLLSVAKVLPLSLQTSMPKD